MEATSHYLNQCWFIVNWILGNRFTEIWIIIQQFPFKKINLKMSSVKWWPFCLCLHVLTHWSLVQQICYRTLDNDMFRQRLLVCLVLSHDQNQSWHYTDVIMGSIASQITSLMIVYSNVYSDADQRKHQSSASLAFVRGIHRGPVNSPHKWPVTRKMLPFDDVIMDWIL